MKVTILGDAARSPAEVRGNYGMFSWALAYELSCFPGAELRQVQHSREVDWRTADCGDGDVLLVHVLWYDWQEHIAPAMEALRKRYKVIASFLSFPVPYADFSWSWVPGEPKYPHEVVAGPHVGHLLRHPMYKGAPVRDVVLLDHAWPWWLSGDSREWTRDLLREIEPLALAGEFRFARLVHPMEQGRIPKYPWLHELPMGSLIDYLLATRNAGTFVTAHHGSYNSSIVDMLARGKRVITGRYHTPDFNLRHFGLPFMESPKDVVRLLREPWSADEWMAKADLCTDTRDVAVRMMAKWNELLGKSND